MIVFLGIAGSGKTTQAKLLAAYLKVPRLSIGQILRDNMQGQYAQEMLEGKVIDDSALLPILDKELTKLNAAKSEIILDGSPRTLRQAQWLDGKVKAGQLFITAVIHLTVSKDVVKQRLLARGRPDNREPAISERFREYDEAIKPILDYLTDQKYRICEISAGQTEQEIAAEIDLKLKNET